MAEKETIKCPTCKGKGFIMPLYIDYITRCLTCKGSGKVEAINCAGGYKRILKKH